MPKRTRDDSYRGSTLIDTKKYPLLSQGFTCIDLVGGFVHKYIASISAGRRSL